MYAILICNLFSTNSTLNIEHTMVVYTHMPILAYTGTLISRLDQCASLRRAQGRDHFVSRYQHVFTITVLACLHNYVNTPVRGTVIVRQEASYLQSLQGSSVSFNLFL